MWLLNLSLHWTISVTGGIHKKKESSGLRGRAERLSFSGPFPSCDHLCILFKLHIWVRNKNNEGLLLKSDTNMIVISTPPNGEGSLPAIKGYYLKKQRKKREKKGGGSFKNILCYEGYFFPHLWHRPESVAPETISFSNTFLPQSAFLWCQTRAPFLATLHQE